MIRTRIMTDDIDDTLAALGTLAEHAPEVPALPALLGNADRLLRDPTYQLLVADDESGAITAAGILTFFYQPMAEVHILAVEALWCRDDDADMQRAIWRALVQRAQQLEFGGVCIPPHATNAAAGLRQLVERRIVNDCPVTMTTLPLQKQGNAEAVVSAFSKGPIEGSVFVSVPVVTIHTRKTAVDVTGREFTRTEPLYRGEGRKEYRPHWDCANLRELAAVHFAHGFYAKPRAVPAGRSDPFGGSIAEQLLHQGGVGQGAVSLSTSFDVAANYATHAGRRDEALVFTVDTDRLRRRMKIFDASTTLEAACPWIPMDAWAPLRRVVRALWRDLPAAGRFLERCYEECFDRAAIGLGSLAPPPDIDAYFALDTRAALDAAGVTRDELLRVHQVFEEFTEFAQQRVGSADILHTDEAGGYSVETQRVGPMAYFEVFGRIKDELLEARQAAEPGWDNTPFGYLAKTGRDAECFAAAQVPGDLIVGAVVVDRNGRRLEEIRP